MVRRAVGVGVIVLLLILIVLGIRGCLNARKERSFENYARDLNAIAAQSKQLSDDFFARLSDPGNLTAAELRGRDRTPTAAARRASRAGSRSSTPRTS